MNILIVDDHEVIFSGLKSVLASLYEELNFTCASSENEFLSAINGEIKFDLCFLDISMGDTDIFTLVRQLKEKIYKKRIIVYSMYSEKLYSEKLRNVGVDGYVSKSANLDELKVAITKVVNGFKHFQEKEEEKSKEDNSPFQKLSKRELEIATLILQGASISMISRKTNLEISTISTYKKRLFEKLNIKNMVELYDIAKLYLKA